ncbi:MDIS1-interacting receptor kinase [Salix suchowensis]|nr:MDIS1-interacting receptor kinase [Salix suchowensis]
MKFLASETEVSDLQWFEWIKVPIIVAVVVVIVLLFRGCCGGKTMKAPGRNSRIRRSHFEANPSAYFRSLHKGR